MYPCKKKQVATVLSSVYWTHLYTLLCIVIIYSLPWVHNSRDICGGRNIWRHYRWYVFSYKNNNLKLKLTQYKKLIDFLNLIIIIFSHIRFSLYWLCFMLSNYYLSIAITHVHLSGGSACTLSCSSSCLTNSTKKRTKRGWVFFFVFMIFSHNNLCASHYITSWLMVAYYLC